MDFDKIIAEQLEKSDDYHILATRLAHGIVVAMVQSILRNHTDLGFFMGMGCWGFRKKNETDLCRDEDYMILLADFIDKWDERLNITGEDFDMFGADYATQRNL